MFHIESAKNYKYIGNQSIQERESSDGHDFDFDLTHNTHFDTQHIDFGKSCYHLQIITIRNKIKYI